ncbi:MAG: branched-chain amino acid ABC transporter permease [Candidatus Kariarchaeaceae archaeon]
MSAIIGNFGMLLRGIRDIFSNALGAIKSNPALQTAYTTLTVVEYRRAFIIGTIFSYIGTLIAFFTGSDALRSMHFIALFWFFLVSTKDLDTEYVNQMKFRYTIANLGSILLAFIFVGYSPLAAEIVLFVVFYLMLAVSLNMSTGLIGVLNFGVVAQLTVGAIVYALATVNFGVPIFLAIIYAMLGSALFSALIAITTLRLRDDYFAIVSITIGEIFRQFLRTEPTLRGPLRDDGNLPTTEGILNIPQPFFDWYQVASEGTIFEDISYRFILGFVGIVMVIGLFIIAELILKSPYGRVMKSIREDDLVTSTYGKDLLRYKVEVLALSGAVAGLGGVFYAWIFTVLFPDYFQPLYTFFVWTILIIGGRGNNHGMVVGAIAFVLLRRMSLFFNDLDVFYIRWINNLVSVVNPTAPDISMTYLQLSIVGIVLILFIRFYPSGLVPEEPYRPKIGGKSLPPPGSQSEDQINVREEAVK